MKKKKTSNIFLWVTVSLVVIGGGGAFYYYNYYLMKLGVPVYRAIPKNNSLIFEFNNIHNTIDKINKSDYRPELEKTELFSKISSFIYLVDSLLKDEAELNALFHQRKMLASLHLTKSGEYDYLFVLDLSKTSPVRLGKIFNQLNISFDSREFEKTEIIELKKNPLVFSYKNGLLMMSKTAFLVEDALRQLKDKNSILKDASFVKVKELSAKNADCSLYVNYQNLPLLASVYVGQTYQNILEKLKESALWSSLDMVINEKNILLTGYTDIDADKSFLSVFLPTTPPENELINILFDNIAVLLYYAMENANPPFAWMGNQWAYSITEPFDTNLSAMESAVIKVSDIETAEEKFNEISEQKNDSAATIEVYKDFKIKKINDDNYSFAPLGKIFENIKNPYYTFIGNFAVCCNSIGELRNFIDKYYNQQTLSRNDDYLSFSENLNSSSGFFIYLNLSKSLQILNAFAPEKFTAELKNNFQYYQKFSPIALQFSSYKDMFYTTVSVNYSSAVSKQKGILWKTALDTAFDMSPKIMLNHASKENEIMVQDLKNNLYLLSKGGQIIWQKNLEEKIMSEIYQIDFLKNGKLQYFFNTKNKVWLIDRNGEEVNNFSLRLNSPASAGMLLIDYDNAKNYRFFIPCENGNIYGYEISGKPLQGWNPKNNTGIMRQPVQYFLVDKKDYLLAVNDEGTAFLFNRRGEQKAKMELKTQFTNQFYLHEIMKDKKTKMSYLVSADTTGKIFTLNFEGKFASREFNKTGKVFKTSRVLFGLTDIAGDSLNEFCFADTNGIFVFKNDTTLLYDYHFNSDYAEKLFFINEKESSKSKLAAVNTNNQLFLFNADGTVSGGFPVSGNTPYSISDFFKDNGSILIAGDKEGQIFVNRLE